MATQIRSIFSSLASWELYIAQERVKSPYLLQLEDNPFDGLCPYRILSPALNRSEGELSGQTLGNSFEVKWTIDDLLLFRSTLAVPSFSDVVVHLMDYMVAYAEKWVTSRRITPQSFIESVKPFTAGIFEYPAKSETLYYGVLATLVIRENVDG